MDVNIIQCIYKSCDENNTNSVAVSSLINFIKPYMPNNVSELVELKSKLDPNDSDPHVDSTFFQEIMSHWISTIQAEDTSNTFSEFSVNINQSSSSDASQMSSYNLKSNNNSAINEIASEEQIQRLKYQLNKATMDLNVVRQQLTALEDHNESLLIELNLRRNTENTARNANEALIAITSRNEDFAEEVNLVSRKCEQLERTLSHKDKEQQNHLAQIVQLENENTHLRNKLQSFEKMKRESRKSLTEMSDCLDVKESEISTLMEIIENLKGELVEKSEVASFYSNEHKLLKQRTHELETLLKTRITHTSADINPRHLFNTPKLQKQLANPVTPFLSSPIPEGFNTSSPKQNSSFECVFSNDSDLCHSVGVLSVLRSPHKTLKEELSEISYGKLNNSLDEIQHQERDYEKEYFDLLQKMKEKDQYVDKVTMELEMLKQKIKKDEKTKAVVIGLDLELKDVEHLLYKQKVMNVRTQLKLKRLQITLSEKIKNHEKIHVKKTSTNQSTQTDLDVKIPEPRYTNHAKLQLKLDRLLERKENIEADLLRERNVNVKLTQNNKQKCAENVRIATELKSLREKVVAQETSLKQLMLEQNNTSSEYSDLVSENATVKTELATCVIESRGLEQRLRDTLEKLTLEVGTNDRLRLEIEFLMSNQYQMRSKIQEDHAQQLHLQKELFDLRTANSLALKQLRNEVLEKDIEIRTLKKLIELVDGRFFLYFCNEELRKALQHVDDCFKSNDDWIENLSKIEQLVRNDDGWMDLENQMIVLNSNVTFITSLLQSICSTLLSFYDRAHLTERPEISRDEVFIPKNSEVCDDNVITTYNKDSDESFISCSRETSFSEDMPEVELFECDSFLDNLQTEHFDSSLVSKTEMEENVASLASQLTVDVTTSKQRYVNEKDDFRQCCVTFFSSVNYSIHLLKNADCHPRNARTHQRVFNNLQVLKEISHEMLRKAVSCANLSYEIKVTKYWPLMINYVLMLNQESRNVQDSKHSQDVETFPSSSAECHQEDLRPATCLDISTDSKWNNAKFKFWMYTGLFLLSLIVITNFIFYIDNLCPKTGKRTCPIEWFVNFFVEKTHLHKY